MNLSLLLVALGVFVLAVLGMSVGVLISNRRLKGTCGGLGNLRDAQGRTMCDACSTPADECAGVLDGKRRDKRVQSGESVR